MKWPVGLGGKGNEGVAGMVRQMDGAIGYIELIYAIQNKIDYGIVKNAAGDYVKGSSGERDGGRGFRPENAGGFPCLHHQRSGKEAYPISSFTWLLIPEKSKDPAKGKILANFLNWMVDDGQKMTSELAYAPLPDNVAAKVKGAIKSVQ